MTQASSLIGRPSILLALAGLEASATVHAERLTYAVDKPVRSFINHIPPRFQQPLREQERSIYDALKLFIFMLQNRSKSFRLRLEEAPKATGYAI